MLDRIFSLVRVNRKLILGKNATLVSTSAAGVESNISVTELAALDVTPGTVTAGKAVVVGANKNIDTIAVAEGGLKIGVGAGTAMTASAAELNFNDGSVAGTAVAGKAVVVDASKNIAGFGSVTSNAPTGGGIGYATGAGGAVTQLTSRTTGVTLSTLSGTITTNIASLAAEASADFVVTNTTVAAGDVVNVSIQSGSNGGGTIVSVSATAAGSFTIRVHNGNVAAGTAETGAILINFAVFKAVSA